MRYLMRQKWLSLGDDFFIQDDQGRDLFRVDGKAFCFGDQLSVSKQWFSWTDTYGVEIAHGNNDLLVLAATVVIDMACHEKD